MSTESLRMDKKYLIDKKYQICKSIGKGSFGEVFAGRNLFGGETVAIKFERLNSQHPQLAHEFKVYQQLKGATGIPDAICFGAMKGFEYMVMELLGPSLENLFNYCKRSFSLKTVLMLAEKMMRRLEYVHQNDYIHRDLKPDNFVLGPEDSSTEIFLIDFGLAQRFCKCVDGKVKHVDMQKRQSFTGTARYASIHSQQRFTQSRRDDLESIGYMLVYFLKGKLPWQSISTKMDPKERKEKILEMKLATKLSTLCDGLPIEFDIFLKYCRELEFDRMPNYAYLRKLFSDLFERKQFKRDFVFDWKIKADREMKEKQLGQKNQI